jgi:hypothetical protein
MVIFSRISIECVFKRRLTAKQEAAFSKRLRSLAMLRRLGVTEIIDSESRGDSHIRLRISKNIDLIMHPALSFRLLTSKTSNMEVRSLEGLALALLHEVEKVTKNMVINVRISINSTLPEDAAMACRRLVRSDLIPKGMRLRALLLDVSQDTSLSFYMPRNLGILSFTYIPIQKISKGFVSDRITEAMQGLDTITRRRKTR